MWPGAPWARGKRALAVTAFERSAAAMGRIETTMGPWKTPAGRHGIDVRHIATFLPCVRLWHVEHGKNVAMWRAPDPGGRAAGRDGEEDPALARSLQYLTCQKK